MRLQPELADDVDHVVSRGRNLAVAAFPEGRMQANTHVISKKRLFDCYL